MHRWLQNNKWHVHAIPVDNSSQPETFSQWDATKRGRGANEIAFKCAKTQVLSLTDAHTRWTPMHRADDAQAQNHICQVLPTKRLPVNVEPGCTFTSTSDNYQKHKKEKGKKRRIKHCLVGRRGLSLSQRDEDMEYRPRGEWLEEPSSVKASITQGTRHTRVSSFVPWTTGCCERLSVCEMPLATYGIFIQAEYWVKYQN